jgi:hypothetical protein
MQALPGPHSVEPKESRSLQVGLGYLPTLLDGGGGGDESRAGGNGILSTLSRPVNTRPNNIVRRVSAANGLAPASILRRNSGAAEVGALAGSQIGPAGSALRRPSLCWDDSEQAHANTIFTKSNKFTDDIVRGRIVSLKTDYLWQEHRAGQSGGRVRVGQRPSQSPPGLDHGMEERAEGMEDSPFYSGAGPTCLAQS